MGLLNKIQKLYIPKVEVNNKASTVYKGAEPIKWKVTSAWATAQTDMKTLLNSRKSKTGLSSFFIL